MAFDFVQLDTSLPTSIPVRLAADELGLEPWAVLGLLWELQVWAVQAIPTGRFTPSPASAGRPDAVRAEESAWSKTLERAVHWTGASGAVWTALLRAGLLLREGDSVRLTTSDRYVQVLEKRAREAERKRVARARARGGASAGRPPDVRAKKRRDEMREEEASAAAGEGVSAGRPVLSPLPPPPDVSADGPPVQRALPGTHLVPASPSRDERRQEAHGEAVAAPPGEGAPPPPPRGSTGAAEAFFERCQQMRNKRHWAPEEPMPKGWPTWYEQALEQLGGDERRLADAWGRWLEDDWAISRKPPCPAVAFIGKGTWLRHVERLEQSPAPTQVDTSTDEGRAWKMCLDALEQEGKRYALEWLRKATPVDVREGELVVRCPDVHFRDRVVEDFADMLAEVAVSVGLEGVRWVVAEQSEAATG